MSNQHHHHHHHHDDVKNIKVAFLLNFGFAIVEIIGGVITNSVAIMSDAIHDLGDSFSLAMAWYLQKVAKKKSDKNYSYGYKRFSILGAIINSVILIVGSIFVLSVAVPRIFNPQDTNAKGMFLLAILGIIINGLAVLRLRHGKSINEKVVSLHLLEDVLGWVAILIGSVFIHYFNLTIIDPILSVGISIYVLYNVYKNMRESMRVILQGVPLDIDIESIKSTLLSKNKEICDLHDMHIWTTDGLYNIITVHIVLSEAINFEQQSILKNRIRKQLLDLKIEHSTIEFETKDEICCFEESCC